MKAHAEQLAKMSETLESSGFSRTQSNAVIESVAMAMETFAVTPEMLDERIDGLRDEMNAQFAAQGKEIKNLSKCVGRIEERVDRLEAKISAIDQRMMEFQQRMIEFQRSTIRYMLAFLVLMLGAVVGMFGAIFSQFLLT